MYYFPLCDFQFGFIRVLAICSNSKMMCSCATSIVVCLSIFYTLCIRYYYITHAATKNPIRSKLISILIQILFVYTSIKPKTYANDVDSMRWGGNSLEMIRPNQYIPCANFCFSANITNRFVKLNVLKNCFIETVWV